MSGPLGSMIEATYRVDWSEEDGEYVGLCAQYPSLSWLAATPEEALKGIQEVVAEVSRPVSSARLTTVKIPFRYNYDKHTVPLPVVRERYFGYMAARYVWWSDRTVW